MSHEHGGGDLLLGQASGQVRTFSCRERLNCVRFLDDDRLVIGGSASSISIFETRMDRLKDLARSVAGRELTAEEIERFRVEPGK